MEKDDRSEKAAEMFLVVFERGRMYQDIIVHVGVKRTSFEDAAVTLAESNTPLFPAYRGEKRKRTGRMGASDDGAIGQYQ